MDQEIHLKVLRHLEQNPDVVDRAGAPDLVVQRGEVLFDDVRFAYDPGREILKGVTIRWVLQEQGFGLDHAGF